MNIYNYEVKDAKGEVVSLKKYEGKVLLIVNTATECGFTPHYSYLQQLYTELGNDKFEILDFPCNQFGNQAPGTEDEIHNFCTSRFGTTFPLFSKIDVNGENEEPLFAFLKSQKGFKGFDANHELTKVLENMLKKANPNYASSPDIKWNFTKFLVDINGNVIERFEPTKSQETVENAVKKLVK